ncbi:MAG: hypothetical protein V5783_02765 [Pontiella sp.]
MHRLLSVLLFSTLIATGSAQEETRIFRNHAGEPLTDRIVRYDFQKKEVTMENSGKVPLETFRAEDQAYILHWNQIQGFQSTMRFKIKVKRDDWASMKHEQNVTPVYMDAIQIPGKKNPNHHIEFIENYEEYNAIYLQAEGYEIMLRNQNFFPLENIVVESKIFYEQELYILTDSLFVSSEKEYYDTVVTNKVRFLSETIPIIIPLEEVFLNSECAIIIDHQVQRNALITSSKEEDEEGETTTTMEGFGEWDDHGRRRRGRIHGAWFRIGMENPEGEMVWREVTAPSSLDSKVSWEGFPKDEDEDEDASEDLSESTTEP